MIIASFVQIILLFSMLQSSLFTSILALCRKHGVEKKEYKTGDIVVDHESNHNLYVFSSGRYNVWSTSPFGEPHEVGEIDAPNMLGEGVFFGSFQKPVKVVTEKDGDIYILTEKTISEIVEVNPYFREILMRACLAVTNSRIQEANTERTLDHALVDALETNSFGNIPTLLTVLKKTFLLSDVVWIERHEILTDIFAIRYRESMGTTPVNERINMKEYGNIKYQVHSLNISHEVQENEDVKDVELLMSRLAATISEQTYLFEHIFALSSRGVVYGYLIYILPNDRIPGYIERITEDLVPNCIRLIESSWHKHN